MNKFFPIYILLNLLVLKMAAQSLLTPDDAVNMALKNNYNILVARNNADIAKINNSVGNAGMLPNVAINGSDNYTQSNLKVQTETTNLATSYPNSTTNNLSAGVALSWTLFDGGKMFVTKSKLSEIEALGEIQFKDQVLQSIFDVTSAYFTIVKQKQQLIAINQVIKYNQERVKILQTSYGAGLSPKTNLLQAKIDLNVYLENAISQQSVIIAAKRTLNQLLARDSDATFDVIDSILLNYTPNKDELTQKLYTNNTSVLYYEKQMEIAKLILKEYNAARLPKLTLNGGYNMTLLDYTNSNNTYNHSYGPTVGASLVIPIFQGGSNMRQVATSKIQLQSAEYYLSNAKIYVNVQLQNALTDYENEKQLYELEKENSALAKENLEISIQRLRLGQTTSLELRQAEESFESSLSRLINFQFNLKIAETKLKQLLAAL
jgi:outer membrane protein